MSNVENSSKIISLSTIPMKVISLPTEGRRREHMNKLAEKHSLKMSFVDGVVMHKKIPAVIQAHRNALDEVTSFPTLVMEDDLMLTSERAEMPAWPEDADIVYLFTHPLGTLPMIKPNLRLMGWRALGNLTLAKSVDENYARLFTMIGGLAIIYVTQKGRDIFAQAIDSQNVGRMPADVAFANAMSKCNVYGLKEPLLVEDMDMQKNSKSDDGRAALTNSKLMLGEVGEIRDLNHKRFTARAQIMENDEGHWYWKILESTPREPK